MMKEINYSPEEGILPDAGDINFDIVQEIINMDNDEEDDDNDIYNIDKNKFNNNEDNTRNYNNDT